MSDDWLRVFLKIIGRQPVVLLSRERLEEAPRPAGRKACFSRIFLRQRWSFDGLVTTGPMRYERRQSPRDEERQSEGQSHRLEPEDEQESQTRNHFCRPHE